MNPFIACDFEGRLGNNMFQVATAFGYAFKHDCDWGVFPGYLHEEIYDFGLPSAPDRYYTVYQEPSHGYAPLPYDLKGKDVRIKGFFQSYRYFHFCEMEIRNLFLQAGSSYDAVSIHVRRTDFLVHKHNVTMPNSYFAQAINYFRNKGHHTFCVFSDDIDWCAENLPKLTDAVLIMQRDGDAFSQLQQMARCRHNIITNSMYSWWAAYLNPHRDKTVVAPGYSYWFHPDYAFLDTSELMPPEWVQLPILF